MNVREFLLTSNSINLAEVARLMWPNNRRAKGYLYQKLHEKDNRTFTDKDAALARRVLTELAHTLINLT